MLKTIFRVDFSNGLLSEKIKQRAEKLNLHVTPPYSTNDDKVISSDANLNEQEDQTESPLYSVSNSLSDRLGTGSQSTDQNVLYRRYVFDKL